MVNTKEADLLSRIKSALENPVAPISGAVQDCLSLARLRGDLEWTLYFEFQLTGVTVSGVRPPTLWKGDPKSLQWQPALLFAEDRKTDDDKISSHSIDAVETMLRDLEAEFAKPRKSDATWGNRIEAAYAEQDARRSALQTAQSMKRHLTIARTRVRQYAAEAESGPKKDAKIAGDPSTPKREKVFIGHGHSKEWHELSAFLSDRLDLDWDEFNRVSPAGKTTVARLEEMLGSATFAFLVLTAEDERVDGATTARQNVVHEAGLFQGRLGFHRAIILLESGCEEFSNIHGLGQIRFPAGNLTASFEELRKVLEREGFIGSKRDGSPNPSLQRTPR